jgi:hypothetical protein
MKTHILTSRRFAYSCIVSLVLPWGCFCGERDEVVAKGWTLELLIERLRRVEEKGIAYDKAHPPSNNWGGGTEWACQLVNTIGRLGDRAALPFLEGKSLMTNAPSDFRERAAAAYVKIANLDESVGLMRKLNEDASAQGAWRYLLNKAFLEKVKSEAKSLTPKTMEEINSFLLEIVQNAKTPGDARNADLFLLDRIPEYANSRQRATLSRYANTGTEYTTNTFNPIKAHFDKIPPSKRIDLRKRFPDLPPLPEDKNAGTPLKVALAIGAGLVAVCITIWIVAKRRKPQTREKE